jgi:gluconate:H+ symporter, GntP family
LDPQWTRGWTHVLSYTTEGATGNRGGRFLPRGESAGSLIFSHVNDGGFWLVKEYFGMSVVQTIKTWSVCETIISVTALMLTIALSLVV